MDLGFYLIWFPVILLRCTSTNPAGGKYKNRKMEAQ